jgi:hypothetical protein
MTIEEIKSKLAKKAVEFETGGFKPSNSITESWIGRVYLYAKDEDIPLDASGKAMYPLFQLCLTGLPFVPEILSATKVITVFVAEELPSIGIVPNGQDWLLREYKQTDELIVKNLSKPKSPIKPFPLKPVFVEKDYPVWDSGDIPSDVEDAILEIEETEGVEYYDMIDNHDLHKLGGYPAYIQSGTDFGDGFEFVLQISSDEKANFNVIDSGNIYLAKNKESGKWVFYCDFY